MKHPNPAVTAAVSSLFSKAMAGLAKQQFRRSYGPFIDADGCDDKGCLYRGPDGLKCFAGQLIADEHYDPDMEGGTIDSVGSCGAGGVLGAILASNPEEFDVLRETSAVGVTQMVLSEGQLEHDRDRSPVARAISLLSTAERFGLTLDQPRDFYLDAARAGAV